MKKKSTLLVLLAVLFVIAASYQTMHTIEGINELFYGNEQVQSQFWIKPVSRIITGVTPEAKQAGISEGDLLLTVNGQPYTGTASLIAPLMKAHPGDTLTVRISHLNEGGQVEEKEINLPLAANDKPPPRIGQLLSFIIILLVMPVFAALLGFWVTATRPAR